MRILIVEDSAQLAQLMAEGLRPFGFTTDCAASLAEADHALELADYAAVILDLGLPDGDGRAWLRARRGRAPGVPVLILTARGLLEDRVSGLDSGADDYLVKPVEIAELAARLRALLRRPGARAPVVLTSGTLRFDTESRMAECCGKPLELARRETTLLELLMRREGAVVRREAIEDALYGFDEPVTPNAVEAVVSRLRRKLDEACVSGRLHTIRGVGYMLTVSGSGGGSAGGSGGGAA